jgi:hypothetical protein
MTRTKGLTDQEKNVNKKEELKNLDIEILKSHKGLGDMIKKSISLRRSHDTPD